MIQSGPSTATMAIASRIRKGHQNIHDAHKHLIDHTPVNPEIEPIVRPMTREMLTVEIPTHREILEP